MKSSSHSGPCTLGTFIGEKGQDDIWLATHARFERDLSRSVAEVFEALGGELLARLNRLLRVGDVHPHSVDALLSVGPWAEALRAAAEPHLKVLVQAGAAAEWELHRPRERADALTTVRRGLTYPMRAAVPPEVGQAVTAFLREAMAGDHWEGMIQAVRSKVRTVLGRGLREGADAEAIGERLYYSTLGVGMSRQRAALIARTEGTGALNAGHQAARDKMAAAGRRLSKVWRALHDSRTRDAHSDADGQEVPSHGHFLVGGERCRFPGDNSLSPENRCNCILPGARVQGRVQAAVRSEYDGEAVEIVTRAGRRLSLTPNHPVLTTHGFVAAGDLEGGEKLVAYNGQVDSAARMRPGGDQVNDVPPKIEEVFQAFVLGAVPGGHTTIEVGSAQVDYFHGDGQSVNGQVEVVWAYGSLRERVPAGGGQEYPDGVLSLADSLRHRRCTPLQRVGRVLHSAPRPTSRESLALAHFRGYDNPFMQLSFGAASDLDTGFAEGTLERRTAAPTLVRQLLERYPVEVALDEVAQVRKRKFRGHVYDLQCEDGLIVADGLYISNCRCRTGTKDHGPSAPSEALGGLLALPPSPPTQTPLAIGWRPVATPAKATDPQARAAVIDLMADILGGLLGEHALLAFPDKKAPFNPLQHPRDAQGRFIAVGSAEAVNTALQRIELARRAKPGPEQVRQLAEHLSVLTVKQLQEVKQKYNLKASGRVKAELIRKLSELLPSTVGQGAVAPQPRPGALLPPPAVDPATYTVNVHRPEFTGPILEKLFGHQDAARVAQSLGAPAGADVQLTPLADGKRVTVSFHAGKYHEDVGQSDVQAIRTLGIGPDGKRFCANESLYLHEDVQKQGLGTDIFARQVEALSAAGFSRIDTYGQRAGGNNPANGYYTWPRLGYEGNLNRDVREKLPPELGSLKTVGQLMATPEGRAWWKENGDSLYLHFSLAKNSRSRQILDGYRLAKQGAASEAAKAPADPYPPRVKEGGYRIDADEPEACLRRLRSLLGDEKATLHDAAALTGAPAGADVHVRLSSSEGGIAVDFESNRRPDGVPLITASRTLRRSSKGALKCHNSTFFVDNSLQGSGLGTEIFARQVGELSRRRFAYIDTSAAYDPGLPGRPKTGMNGYYTWPRLGYDAPLDPYMREEIRTDTSLPPEARKSESISDMMRSVEGRRWWKENVKESIDCQFDLSEGSTSRKVLEGYLKERARRRKAHGLPVWALSRKDQARVPAGSPHGGEFTSGTGTGGGQSPPSMPQYQSLHGEPSEEEVQALRDILSSHHEGRRVAAAAAAMHEEVKAARGAREAAAAHAEGVTRMFNAARPGARKDKLERELQAALADHQAAKLSHEAALKKSKDAVGELLRLPAEKRAKMSVTLQPSADLVRGQISDGLGWLSDKVAERRWAKDGGEALAELPVKVAMTPLVSNYNQESGHVMFRRSSTGDVMAHEWGHLMEDHSDKDHRAALAFLKHRVGDEKAVSMAREFPGKGYHDSEMVRKDDFEKAYAGLPGDTARRNALYTGKDYGGKYTEVIAMGVQRMKEDPAAFAHGDPEYFSFVHAILHGRFHE